MNAIYVGKKQLLSIGLHPARVKKILGRVKNYITGGTTKYYLLSEFVSLWYADTGVVLDIKRINVNDRIIKDESDVYKRGAMKTDILQILYKFNNLSITDIMFCYRYLFVMRNVYENFIQNTYGSQELIEKIKNTIKDCINAKMVETKRMHNKIVFQYKSGEIFKVDQQYLRFLKDRPNKKQKKLIALAYALFTNDTSIVRHWRRIGEKCNETDFLLLFGNKGIEIFEKIKNKKWIK